MHVYDCVYVCIDPDVSEKAKVIMIYCNFLTSWQEKPRYNISWYEWLSYIMYAMAQLRHVCHDSNPFHAERPHYRRMMMTSGYF